MTTKILTVVFADESEAFTTYSTTSDSALPSLYTTRDLVSRSKHRQKVEIVDIKVDGFEEWVGLSNGSTLLAPLSPFIQYFEDNIEGVSERGLIHIRKLRAIGPALCGHEFENPKALKKYVFTEAFGCTTDLMERPVLEKHPYDLVRDGNICFACMANDITYKIMNFEE